MIREPGFFVRTAWLIPFFPLLGAAIAAFGARRLRFQAHIPVIAGIALAFLYSLGTLTHAGPDETYRAWLRVLNEDVIQGEFGYEEGEFTAFPSLWHHLYAEGLTPRQAWQRAMDAHRNEENA